MERRDARRSGPGQPRDRAGRFEPARHAQARDVSLDAPPEGVGREAREVLRDQGHRGDASARQAEQYEPVELPEHASALNGAIAEAQLAGVWVAKPRGPVGPALAA